MIDISVIMPVHNGEIHLRQAIESIINQTFDNFELIIINNASTDATAKVIESYNDSRIHGIQNSTKKGNYPSRNKGMKLAKGKYICVMDADDIAFPQRLEIQYAYLEKHPETLAIGTNFVFSEPGIKRELSLSYEELMIDLLVSNAFLHPSLMIRNDVLKKHNGYNEKYIYSADYDLMARLALAGKVENLPDILMTYRLHKCQISQLHRGEQKAYGDEIRRNYQIEFINRYKKSEQQSPDRWVVGFPQIGEAIALYTYARYTGDTVYGKQAEQIIDNVLENKTEIIPSLGLERTLCSLGCGLIYLLRNGFVEGNEDEVLGDLDERLFSSAMNWDEKEEDALSGWIHYLTSRIEVVEESSIRCLNKQNLIHFLDRLGKKKITDKLLLEDIRKINSLGVFPVRTQWLLNTEYIDFQDSYKPKKILDASVTFVIPVRIDSSERQENLNVVLDQLSKRKQTQVIILEADIKPIYQLPGKYPNVTYRFEEDNDPVFYRTKYLNELLQEAKTSIVGIWDTDVIVPDDQIDHSINDIREGKAVMSFPYGGRFSFCSLEDSFVYRHKRSINFLKEKEHSSLQHSVGGAFFVNKEVYLETGGENEHFYGWGMEDAERIKRMEILGLPVSRINGSLFHLHHPRKENSRFYNQLHEEESRKEFLKVCSMHKEQLKQYIATWKYLKIKSNRMQAYSDTSKRSPFTGNNFYLIEKYNLAFVCIAKNASSHLKNILLSTIYGFYTGGKAAHDIIGYDETSPYLFPVSKMPSKEKDSGKMIKFAVWRDPVDRLISCYKHFCLEKEEHLYFRYLNLYEDNSFERFMEFVRFELGKENPLFQDQHIRKQSDFYHSEDVDFVVPIQKLNQFLEEYQVPVLKRSTNETSVKFQLKNQNLIAEIKDLYKADYHIKLSY